MRNILFLVCFTVFFLVFKSSCTQTSSTASKVYVSVATLKKIEAAPECGEIFVLILKNGTKLVPDDLISYSLKVGQELKVQITYRMRKDLENHPCVLAKPISLSHIDKI